MPIPEKTASKLIIGQKRADAALTGGYFLNKKPAASRLICYTLLVQTKGILPFVDLFGTLVSRGVRFSYRSNNLFNCSYSCFHNSIYRYRFRNRRKLSFQCYLYCYFGWSIVDAGNCKLQLSMFRRYCNSDRCECCNHLLLEYRCNYSYHYCNSKHNHYL